MNKRLANQRRRTNRARKTFVNTCPASRHLHVIAEALASGRPYPMLTEDPEHCAGTMLAVLESLWKARTKLAKPKPPNTIPSNNTDMQRTGAQD